MAEGDGLSNLQMGKAGHEAVSMGLGLSEQGFLQILKACIKSG